MWITDNSTKSFLVLDPQDGAVAPNSDGKLCLEVQNYNDLQAISDCKLKDLRTKNPGLLVFPQSFEEYMDNIQDETIFSMNVGTLRDDGSVQNGSLVTGNMMGFVGRNDTVLTIGSRFALDDKKVVANTAGTTASGEEDGITGHRDYFLHYMLQKVLAINVLDFDQTCGKERIWDFMLYLFPYFLKKAFAQGIYKEYRRHEYNDADVRGTIDVSRHIRLNIPFQGKVAYTVREYSYDNPVMQLIRHTIEHIRCHPFGRGILNSDSDTRNCVSTVCDITQTTYNKNLRQRVISQNLRPVTHPYFSQYANLQRLCLKILRHEKITFGESKDKVYGLLFDGSWLWEEYINTLIRDKFNHPRNKTHELPSHVFKGENNGKYLEIYPDFISKESPYVVGDTKYIKLEKTPSGADSASTAAIYYKTIMYMYRFRAKDGLLIFPYPWKKDNGGQANDTDQYVKNGLFDFHYYIMEEFPKEKEYVDINKPEWPKLRTLGLLVPQDVRDFNDFCSQMKDYEIALTTSI